MQPRINIITLGSQNIEKLRKFYEEGLQWQASSISNEHFVAFHTDGVILCLYLEVLLAEDAMTIIDGKRGFRGITLAHNVIDKNEVDTILKQAVQAGATLEKEAQNTFWGGYSGYFSDPDGHFWEVAWNPHWPLLKNGMLQLPK